MLTEIISFKQVYLRAVVVVAILNSDIELRDKSLAEIKIIRANFQIPKRALI